MRKIVLYIGQSLDGYMADTFGRVAWMTDEQPSASVVQTLQRADLIDVYHLAILSVILGSGTRLFADDGATFLLHRTRQVSANGIVEMTYEWRCSA